MQIYTKYGPNKQTNQERKKSDNLLNKILKERPIESQLAQSSSPD